MENLEESQTSPFGQKSFRVDPSHLGHRLNGLPLSTRARNVLRSIGVESLQDAQGMPHQRILESKNCGVKTYEEIVRVLESYEQADGNRPRGGMGPAVSNHRLISIPTEAQAWPLDLLPLSVRLRHALQKLNCRVLGDLNGLSYGALAEMPDCGVRTLNELRDFVTRVQKGEFGIPREKTGETSSAFLTSRIDAFLDTLSPQHKQIFTDRVGATANPMTLIAVGKKFSMTRERVRQIVSLLLEKALRFGGPPFARSLHELTDELNRKLLPLTPALLTKLLGEHASRPKYLLPFYIRLLGWLSPSLFVWPVGQTPAAYRTANQERIITKLKHWFAERTTPATTSEAFEGICKSNFECTPFEFLEALRFAAEFAVDLTDPENPMIQPPIEAPRRWARRVLSEDATTLPTETVARARAFLNSRRSPGSRYRLASVKQ